MMNDIEFSLLKSASVLWWSGWSVFGDDPEAVARVMFDQQVGEASALLGLDAAAASAWWIDLIGRSPFDLVESRGGEAEAARICSALPARLARHMPRGAVAYIVGYRVINAGRPFRIDWVVPIGRSGPITTIVVGMELAVGEFDQIR